MNGWELIAWIAMALLTVFRVAVVVGFVALIVAIVRALRSGRPAPQGS